MSAYLDGIKGEYSGKRIHLGYSQTILGRGSASQVRFQAANISREHAVVYFTNGVYAVQDCNSRLGTFVNGKAVTSAQLRSGDVITIGSSEFRFVQVEQPVSQSVQRPVQPVQKRNNLGVIFIIACVLILGIWVIISQMNRTEQEIADNFYVEENDQNVQDEVNGNPENITDDEEGSISSSSIVSADYLFRDDFETGLSNAWQAEDGEWHMVNGRLQAVSGHPASIMVGEAGWRDYTIEMKIGGLQNTITGALQYLETDPNIFIIGVRNSEKGSYFFALANHNQDCSLLNENDTKITFYEGEEYIEEDETHLVRVSVEGNIISLFVDGRTICSFSDNTLQTGKVNLASYPGTGDEPAYPWVEEITITQR